MDHVIARATEKWNKMTLHSAQKSTLWWTVVTWNQVNKKSSRSYHMGSIVSTFEVAMILKQF